MNHIKRLLDLISLFPRVSPSTLDSPAADLDISQLFRQIRSRYKALCATVGVRPSLRASEVGDVTSNRDEMLSEEVTASAPGKRNIVWEVNQDELEVDHEPSQKWRAPQPLSF